MSLGRQFAVFCFKLGNPLSERLDLFWIIHDVKPAYTLKEDGSKVVRFSPCGTTVRFVFHCRICLTPGDKLRQTA
jgi:hypothetical protein